MSSRKWTWKSLLDKHLCYQQLPDINLNVLLRCTVMHVRAYMINSVAPAKTGSIVYAICVSALMKTTRSMCAHVSCTKGKTKMAILQQSLPLYATVALVLLDILYIRVKNKFSTFSWFYVALKQASVSHALLACGKFTVQCWYLHSIRDLNNYLLQSK